MFGSTVLESAIGLVFVFLLVSVLVTAASEVLANALQLRAKCLRQGVEAMLSHGPGKVGGLAEQIFSHPLITGGAPDAAPGGKTNQPSKAVGPSYIPANVFSSALCESLGLTSASTGEWSQKLGVRLAALPAAGSDAAAVMKAVTDVINELSAAVDGASLRKDLDKVATALSATNADVAAAQTALATIEAGINNGGLSWLKPTLQQIAKSPTAKDLLDVINHIPSASTGAAAYLGRLNAWVAALPKDATGFTVALEAAKSLVSSNSAANLRAMLERLPDGDVKRTLLLLCDEAQGDIAAFKLKVEAWFDASMNRVSGWYKRRTAWVNCGLGLVMAVALNVDALLVLERLTTDPSLRKELVTEAETYSTAQKTKDTASAPTGAAAEAAMKAAQANFQAVRKQLDSLGLPIGWARPSADPRVEAEGRVRPSLLGLFTCDGKAWSVLWSVLRLHALGWLLTGLAASLGAPFWFDLLDKFMNIRNSGKHPDKDKKADA